MYIVLGVIVIFLVVFLVWGIASRRHSLPCPTWLGWLVELDNPFAKNSRADVIVTHLDVQPGMSVLDAGCGPGRVTVPLAIQVGPAGRVTAVDIQTGMLEHARKKAQTANLSNIEYVHAGIGDGKLGLARYDRALLVTVLGEIPDRRAALQEIFTALKPGGMLSVTEIIFDPHFQSRSTVAQLANDIGFQEQAFFGNAFAYTLNLTRPLSQAA